MAAAALLGAGPVAPAASAAVAWSVAAHPDERAGSASADRRVLRALAGSTFVRTADGDVDRVEARTPTGEVVGTWTLVGTTDGTDGTARLVGTLDDQGSPAVYTLTRGGGSVVLTVSAATPGTYLASVRGGVVHLDGAPVDSSSGDSTPVDGTA